MNPSFHAVFYLCNLLYHDSICFSTAQFSKSMIFENYPLPFFHAQNEVKGGRMQEVVENIPLEKLKPFPNHPFKIREDEAMMNSGC